MKVLKRIWASLTGKVLVKEITKVKYKGKVYPLWATIGNGSSKNFRTDYCFEVNGELVDIPSDDIEEFISEYILVEKDSLAGVLGSVTFDDSHLKDDQ